MCWSLTLFVFSPTPDWWTAYRGVSTLYALLHHGRTWRIVTWCGERHSFMKLCFVWLVCVCVDIWMCGASPRVLFSCLLFSLLFYTSFSRAKRRVRVSEYPITNDVIRAFSIATSLSAAPLFRHSQCTRGHEFKVSRRTWRLWFWRRSIRRLDTRLRTRLRNSLQEGQ